MTNHPKSSTKQHGEGQTGDAAAHEFLEYPRGKFPRPGDSIGKCWEVINMLYCGQPRDAAIHRAETPAEPQMNVDWGSGTDTTVFHCASCGAAYSHIRQALDCQHSEASGRGEARPRPSTYPSPDRIWLQETSDGTGLDMFWYSTRPDGTLEPDLINPAIEYIPKATHDAEVKRLRTLLRDAGHPRIPKGEESKRRPCWCNTSLYCVDEPNCIATRVAMTAEE